MGLSYNSVDDDDDEKEEKDEKDEKKDDDEKALSLDHDEEETNGNKNKPKEKISDEDFITIKVDDRTFRTYRGTLTQVKGSFIAKLFGAHQHVIHKDNDCVYYLNYNPDTFTVSLDFQNDTKIICCIE